MQTSAQPRAQHMHISQSLDISANIQFRILKHFFSFEDSGSCDLSSRPVPPYNPSATEPPWESELLASFIELGLMMMLMMMLLFLVGGDSALAAVWLGDTIGRNKFPMSNKKTHSQFTRTRLCG